MNSKTTGSHPQVQSPRLSKGVRLRRNACWAVVVIGGVLQFVYTKLKHPATPLVILETLYGLAFIVAVVWLIASMIVARRR
jgi:uncharacterized membrane protein HdeD (DUF308 family)